MLKNRSLFEEPKGDQPPPLWIRAILFLTCTGVSFAHGSNDGQKGIGLMMLILIGLVPAQFALNLAHGDEELRQTVQATQEISALLRDSDIRAAQAEVGEQRQRRWFPDLLSSAQA